MTHQRQLLNEITDRQWLLLDRYAVGELSTDEQQELAREVEHLPILEQLAYLMTAAAESDGAWNADAGWKALTIRMAARRSRPAARLVSPDDAPLSSQEDDDGADTLDANEVPRAEHSTQPAALQHATLQHSVSRPAMPAFHEREGHSSKRILTQLAALAVAVICLAGAGFLFLKPFSHTESAAIVPMREVVTQAGQRGMMRLPDGTVVTLAPQTRLSIPADFGTHSREVYVRGEALFNVRPTSTEPFVVHAQHSIARVLGTQFDVRAYDDARVVTVAVVTGKISLAAERTISPAVIVTAGFMGKVDADGAARVERTDVHQFVAWADGRLSFQNTPVAQVFDKIARYYGVHLDSATPELARRRLTADWDNSSLDHVLQSLSIALHARYERQDDHIVFK